MGDSVFRHYASALNELSAGLAPATDESCRPWWCVVHRLGPWSVVGLLVVCGSPLPSCANPVEEGLRWQLESAAAPAESLVWVEDKDDWGDLPRQIPLVLRDADLLPPTSALPRP